MSGKTCPACGGEGRSMGALGNLAWYRCVNCGWEWSRKARKSSKRVKKEGAK